ncbi:hypothetical protein PsorP6_018806 [Peronosclerospora sorghi]|nr:hypothetical protein PsorP6_018806 [Peronosclerospora sorghi]
MIVLVQTLYTQLGWSVRKVSALKRLIQMPMTLSVLPSLLSDSYPIRGTRVIEYPQRESLRDRGTLQVSYLVFRRVVRIGTSVLSFLSVGTVATPPLSISSCMTLLAMSSP